MARPGSAASEARVKAKMSATLNTEGKGKVVSGKLKVVSKGRWDKLAQVAVVENISVRGTDKVPCGFRERHRDGARQEINILEARNSRGKGNLLKEAKGAKGGWLRQDERARKSFVWRYRQGTTGVCSRYGGRDEGWVDGVT